MDALNGVWSGTYILQIIIQKKLETLTIFEKELDFKDTKFPVKIRDLYKIAKNNCIGIFGYKNKHKYLIYVSKNILIYYC